MYVPEDCYQGYGADLDGCGSQENGGCGQCSYRKKKEKEVLTMAKCGGSKGCGGRKGKGGRK